MMRRLGGVISLTPADYDTFLGEFQLLAMMSAADGVVTSHTRVVIDGETRHLTSRARGSSQAMSATVIRPGELADRRLLAIALDEVSERELGSSIISAVGIRPELARDAFTNEPLSRQGYQPMFTDGFAHGLRVWLATAMPSTIIFVRSDRPPASALITTALRSVPGSMRDVTPVVVVNSLSAQMFATFLEEMEIAPLPRETVLVLRFAAGRAYETFRTRKASDGRRLSSAVLHALAQTAEDLDTYFQAASVDIRSSDETARVSRLERRANEAQQEAARMRASADRLETDLRRARKRLRELEYELGYVESPGPKSEPDPLAADEPAAPPVPAEATPRNPWEELPDEPDLSSFAELLAYARDHLTRLVLPDSLDRSVLPLESDPSAPRWRRRSWFALAMLDAYASARARGDATGSFRAWLAPRPHPVIQEAHIRSSETRTIQGGRKFRDSRTFPVPEAVAPGGRMVFLAHIRIETGSSGLVPRLHFHDDTRPGGTGLVYIGHLGPHLRTRRTN